MNKPGKKRSGCPVIIFKDESESPESSKQTLLSCRVHSVQETLACPLGNTRTTKRSAEKVNMLVMLIYNSD